MVMMTLSTLFLVLGAVSFGLGAFNVNVKLNTQSLGFMFVTLAVIAGRY